MIYELLPLLNVSFLMITLRNCFYPCFTERELKQRETKDHVFTVILVPNNANMTLETSH